MADIGRADGESAVFEALETIASVLTGGEDDLSSALGAVCQHACELAGADAAFVAVPADPNSRYMDIVASCGEIPQRALKIRIPIEDTETGRAYISGEASVIDDFSDASPTSGVLAQIFEAGSGVFAALSPVGTLAVLARQPRRFGDAAARRVRALATMASAAIRIAEGSRAATRETVISALHDGAMQLFYAALLRVEMLKNSESIAEMHSLSEEIATILRDGLSEMRKEVVGAAGIEQSLGQWLNTLAQRLGRETSIRVKLVGEDLPGQHPYTSHLARIALEATSNAIRHGKASEVVIEFNRDARSTILTVEDNGIGFDPATVQKGMGLVHLPKRAEAIGADYHIESNPGSGTRLWVEIRRPD